jgi:uncharacterized protein YutE (UPF0331/DUF86 family)
VTPPSLDRDAILAKLHLLREFLDDLGSVGEVSADRLANDRLARHAVERILTQLVDLTVSINGHVAAIRLGKGPANYRESFELAAKAGAISPELARELAPSVGLRNILTHEYASIDLEIVASSVSRALDSYRRYTTQLARFLRDDASDAS